MADEPFRTNRPETEVMRMTRNFEIRYWMQVFGVSRDELQEAVRAVGFDAEAVRRYLLGVEEDRRRGAAPPADAGDEDEVPAAEWRVAGPG